MEEETKVYQGVSFYICHHCVKYKTIRKGDMKKHLTKTKYCKFYNVMCPIDVNSVLSPEQVKAIFTLCSILSLEHTYTFMFDPSSLKIEDYSTIVNKYQKDENIVDTDYMTHTEESIKSEKPVDAIEPEEPIESDPIIQSPKDAIEALSTKHTKKDPNQQFVCPMCNHSFARMRNLLSHIEKKNRCAHNVKRNIIWNSVKSQCDANSTNTSSTLPHIGNAV